MNRILLTILFAIAVYENCDAQDSFARDSILIQQLREQTQISIKQQELNYRQQQEALAQSQKQTQIILMVILTAVFTLAGLAYVVWRRNQRENFSLERMKVEMQAQELNNKSSENKDDPTAKDNGGFIFLNLPEYEKKLFHDLLVGFEDYAKLKGYSISFSVDNSVKDKIGFKFTINNTGISVSTETVRNDVQEYIQKVKNGEDLENLPILISEEEHSLVLTHLLNRISFLQHNFRVQKNTIEFYEGFIKKIESHQAISSQPSVLVQTGGVHQPQSFLSNNSPGAIQGTNIHDVDSTIRIADSFNEKKNQIDDLGKLIELIRNLDDSVQEKNEITKNLEKVHDELKEEAQPDKKSIQKWLKKAKTYFDVAKFGKELTEFGYKVFESFDLTSVL